jgi:glycosyltransferase involved in cell wall biosynthesis
MTSSSDTSDVAISVVISFFGDYCEFGEKCLASLVKQEFTDFEVIMILDGPTRFRSRVYHDLHKSGLRFKFIENTRNLGLLQSRAKAGSRASGTYMAFLDHDDTYPANFLKELHRTATEAGADVVECPIFEYEVDGTIGRSRRFGRTRSRLGHEILLAYLLGRSANNLVTKLIRRSVWDAGCRDLLSDLGQAYVNYAEDILFTVNVFNNARVYATTSRTHYNYIKRPSSSVNPHSLDVVMSSAEQLRIVLGHIERCFGGSVASEATSRFYLREATWALDHLERRLANIAARVRLNPSSVHACKNRIAALRKRYVERFRALPATIP